MPRNARKGLTVIELVMVILIIGLLIGITMPYVRSHNRGALPARLATISALDSVVVPGSVQRIVVAVTDASGKPLPGVPVTFAVEGGGGALSQTLVQSDSAGRATVTWTVGRDPGANALTATAPGTGPARIAVNARAAPTDSAAARPAPSVP